MTTVIAVNSRFNPHYPVDIPKNTVNAESVRVHLDSEWDEMTVRLHWLNVASDVEKVVLLERDQPNTIPWEVLTELGELRMGLDGMDGGTVVKPTVWLTYGYVVDGVDPESGSDPQPPTPSWEQQMVEQATQANQAAKDAKEYAQKVAESIESAGPYAQEAKEAADAAKAAQNAAATSAQSAADSSKAAETAKQEAQKAAATLPAPSKESAGKALVVNEEGNGYSFVDYLQSLGFELVDTITPNADVSFLYLGEITEFRRMAVLYQRPDYVSNSPAYLRWGVRNASGYGPIIRSDNRYGQRIMGMFERISLKDFKLDYYSSLSVNQYVSDMLYAYRDDKMPNEGFYYAVFGLNQKPFDGTETIYLFGERG